MTRLVHVISTARGVAGAEKVVAALVARGTELGWDQLVLNPFADEARGPELDDLFSGVRFEAFPCSTVSRLPAVRSWLRDRLDAFEPEIIHAHLFHALAAVASVDVAGATRLLTHHHGAYLVIEKRRIQAFVDKHAGARFDRIVAVSEAGMRFLVERYGYPREKIEVILNGWNGAPLPHEGSRSGHHVVSVGNLRPEKGHDGLIRAFARVARDVDDARLTVVGDGPSRPALDAQVDTLGLTERVDLVGPDPDPWPYLARADVAAVPSRSEALGIAAMEAMAAGLPVVASRVGGLPELVKDGVTGYLVEPGDEDELGRRLRELFTSPDLRRRMGQAGRDSVRSMTMEATVERYFELYGRLISSRA